ncbi:transposase [Rhizobium leguminosarum]|uniref:Transposase n=1 Tax=Rhizobium leguminosarum TaxID=384 RepID=A0A6P0C1P5_RHILE|nr:transposase [Rhizobium leguminosarum]NEJ81840.1 transposase [Rhizobium leguminosarum]NEK54707.1 transposase [Rhizobium leguminosarum]
MLIILRPDAAASRTPGPASRRSRWQGSVTARRYGLSRSLLTRWRREYRSGLLSVSVSTSFVPLAISPPPPASSEMTAPLRSEDNKTIEIGLPNGRRLTIPASLDPTILARLLPVLDAS